MRLLPFLGLSGRSSLQEAVLHSRQQREAGTVNDATVRAGYKDIAIMTDRLGLNGGNQEDFNRARRHLLDILVQDERNVRKRVNTQHCLLCVSFF